MTDPTPAQIKAGNYPKGHRNLHGMRLSIENPTGSIRRGTDPDGTPWASQLTHDYGYIRGAWGRDKDHLDVYLGPDADAADRVFVIDQLQPHTAKFDEHKVMLGFPDADAAREAYLDQFPEGWAGAGGVTEMPLSTFKKWAFQKGRRVKPLSTEVAELTAQAYAGGGLVKAIKAASKGRSVAEGASDVPKRLAPLSAVKEPGGNWLTSAPDKLLVDDMGVKIPVTNSADAWRKKQLERYIRNDLGTARDPLLKLEKEGRLHTSTDDAIQQSAYEPLEIVDAMGNNPVAISFATDKPHFKLTGRTKRTPWEAMADSNIYKEDPADALARLEDYDTDAPAWLNKATQPVFSLSTMQTEVPLLGFDHLMDYLDAALTGDPLLATRGLALTPEQLAKSSVPDIVAKTSEWNKLLEAQKLGDLNKGIKQVHWTDPDSGYQIVELAPEGLAAEGAAMKHCVGGYCSQVADGKSRILSVRDRDGKPHATVEVRPGEALDPSSDPEQATQRMLERLGYGPVTRRELDVYAAALAKYKKLPDSIVQIQGPRNGQVDAAAQPALRALLRGNVEGFPADGWGRINNLDRTGLVGDPNSKFQSNIRWKDPEGKTHRVLFETPLGMYTRQELADMAVEQGVPRAYADRHFGNIERIMGDREFAEGGPVTPAPWADEQPDPMQWFSEKESRLDKFIRSLSGASDEPLPAPASAAERVNTGAVFKSPTAGKRPEYRNNRAASAEMPLTAARGALATLLGTPGDIESLGRLLIPGVDEHAAMPTTEFYKEWLPTLGLDREGPHGRMAENVTDTAVLATVPGALVKMFGALRRGASKAGTKAADAMDSWRDSYTPRKAQVDTIFDRAGNILNPRPALPAYAEGGGVQAINDYSDEQYAAAQQWAQGKTGAEIAAKGTELGLSADQFARVLGSPQITGADVAAQGYGTTGGLAVPWMNGIYEAPGVFTNPAETLPAGAWQGGTGANATELANAQQWATGKSAAQIAAQAQSMGLTPEQLYQVFGQEQFGAGLGGYGTESGWQRNNMVWDGTRFVEQPTPQVAAPPDSTWTPAQPLPTPPTAPAPEVHAPTGYLQQTVSGSQAWRAGAPGAQTGWTAAPQYAGGGSVSAPTLDFAELKRQYDPYLFDNNDPYWFTPAAGLDTFGWRIGGSDIAGIKRGAAALGMTYQDAVGAGGGEGENNAGMPEQYGGWDALARAENQPQWMRTQLVNTQTGGESGGADNWVEQTLPDLAAIRTHFGLPEDASEADIFRAVNQKYGDLYSITGTRNGWDNADLTNGIEDPRTHVTATFRESDGQLSPLQVGPEFQHKRSSFFEDLAPALSVVAPMLGGMFLGPLGSSISGSLTQAGVPSFLANAAPNILGKGALSALSGGNFLEGAASGLLGSGVNAMGLPVPASSALKIVGNAALKGNDPLKALVNPGNLLALAKP
jgi:hypothetical protein